MRQIDPQAEEYSARKPRLIILGAGKPYQGDNPSSLTRAYSQSRVLDWTLDAFDREIDVETHFVGGYRLDDVTRSYPDLFYSINPNWETDGSLGTLMVAPLSSDQTTFVCYADIVISSDIVRLLNHSEGDVVVVGDRTWRDRYERRSHEDMRAAEKLCISDGKVTALSQDIPVDEADAEYIGIMKLSPNAVEFLISLREQNRSSLQQQGIPNLVEEFISAGFEVRPVEIDGGWAELNALQDLARFVLGTKADTLERLRTLVRHSEVGKQVQFTVGDWRSNTLSVLNSIRDQFPDNSIAVRSSALTEDGWNYSNAGRYTSILNIPVDDTEQVVSAINDVAASYGDHNLVHQVLVQAMLTDVQAHGVVLTRTLNTGGPYYTINYHIGSDTEAVTSGTSHDLNTTLILKGTKSTEYDIDPRLDRVIVAIKELEDLVEYDALDVEFAMTTDGKVHVLQLRPMIRNQSDGEVPDESVSEALDIALASFESLQKRRPFTLGHKTIFGVMPDWNPAEIIGTKPRRLAMSLYQYLITDEVWATQRAEYGYRDVRPHPLLYSFAGHPYVDAGASLSSFVPASVPDDLAMRLVDHYLDTLEAQPHLHDKLEFRIAFTCLTFDFDEQAARLLKNGFADADVRELRNGLLKVTQNALRSCEKPLESIKVMEDRFRAISQSALDPLTKAQMLLEDCRRYGTISFAHLARSAFIATSMLRGMEAVAITTSQQTQSFLRSVNTVASEFELDGERVSKGRLQWEDFIGIYGHLRPGTYEITSPSYAEEPEQYLRPMINLKSQDYLGHTSLSTWDVNTRALITESLGSLGLNWNVDDFERFLIQAIEGRESSKFAFSRNLSVALDQIRAYGESIGLSRDQLSFISIQDLLTLSKDSSVRNSRSWLAERAEEGERWNRITRAIELPPLLIRAGDFTAFERPQSQPNFVTSQTVVANSIDLTDSKSVPLGLEGAIVLIPQADPGFDWLFGQSIAGLITMYGGANSHMTVRAAEFGLPAAIGVGENLYERLSNAQVIELDCGNQWLSVVR